MFNSKDKLSRNLKARWLSALTCTAVFAGVGAAPKTSDGNSKGNSAVVEIHGMRVDFHLAGKSQRKAVTPSLEKQIEVVNSIDVPQSVREFFRTMTIVVDPAMLVLQTNGQYMQNDSPPYVRMKPIKLPEERAILLHELMHAYHHQVLKMPTPDVEGAYRRALQAGIYPEEFRKAAFLYDSREFFANMATTFLLGKSERPPYHCSIIGKAQPKFVAYLTTLFGPHECKELSMSEQGKR